MVNIPSNYILNSWCPWLESKNELLPLGSKSVTKKSIPLYIWVTLDDDPWNGNDAAILITSFSELLFTRTFNKWWMYLPLIKLTEYLVGNYKDTTDGIKLFSNGSMLIQVDLIWFDDKINGIDWLFLKVQEFDAAALLVMNRAKGTIESSSYIITSFVISL